MWVSTVKTFVPSLPEALLASGKSVQTAKEMANFHVAQTGRLQRLEFRQPNLPRKHPVGGTNRAKIDGQLWIRDVMDLILQSLVHQFDGDIRRGGGNGTSPQLSADCPCDCGQLTFAVVRREETNHYPSSVAVPWGQQPAGSFQLRCPHYLLTFTPRQLAYVVQHFVVVVLQYALVIVKAYVPDAGGQGPEDEIGQLLVIRFLRTQHHNQMRRYLVQCPYVELDCITLPSQLSGRVSTSIYGRIHILSFI